MLSVMKCYYKAWFEGHRTYLGFGNGFAKVIQVMLDQESKDDFHATDVRSRFERMKMNRELSEADLKRIQAAHVHLCHDAQAAINEIRTVDLRSWSTGDWEYPEHHSIQSSFSAFAIVLRGPVDCTDKNNAAGLIVDLFTTSQSPSKDAEDTRSAFADCRELGDGRYAETTLAAADNFILERRGNKDRATKAIAGPEVLNPGLTGSEALTKSAWKLFEYQGPSIVGPSTEWIAVRSGERQSLPKSVIGNAVRWTTDKVYL